MEDRWMVPGRKCIECGAELPVGRTRSKCLECSRAHLDTVYASERTCTRCLGVVPAGYRSYHCAACNKIDADEQYLNGNRGVTRYGITGADFDRMLTEQRGVCAICKGPELTRKRLCVDHDHQTDAVRGLLCSRCNKALGFFGDSTDNLSEAIKYLEAAV